MKQIEETKLCCICKHNELIMKTTFCSHPMQKDLHLKSCTKYNDSCTLFEERPDDFYYEPVYTDKK